jgi:hypothetical protein
MINKNEEIKKIANSVIAECHSDYDGLWCIIGAVKYHEVPFEKSDIRATVFEIIHRILQEKDIVVGDFVRKNDVIHFQPWDYSIEQAIARIDNEWNQLGRDPGVNEIAWFVAKNILPKP